MLTLAVAAHSSFGTVAAEIRKALTESVPSKAFNGSTVITAVCLIVIGILSLCNLAC